MPLLDEEPVLPKQAVRALRFVTLPVTPLPSRRLHAHRID